jgi:hypothetical protein
MQQDFGTRARESAEWVPQILTPILIFIIGVFVAYLAGYATRKLFDRLRINERVSQGSATDEGERRQVDVASIAGSVVYYGGLLFVFMAVVESFGMGNVATPAQDLLGKVFAFIPNLIAALILGGIAWVVASLLRGATRRVFARRATAGRFDPTAGPDPVRQANLARSVSEAVYWLVFLLFLPAILNALALEGLLGPVRNMMDQILRAIPNVIVGAFLIAVGWFIARVVQRLTTNLLESAGVDRLSARIGVSSALGQTPLSAAIGMLAFVLVFVPALIAGLNAMGIEAIARPATDMLGTMLAMLPRLLGAALILAIAYVVGRLAGGIVERLLQGIAFDQLPERLGIATREERLDEGYRPSRVAHVVVVVAALLIGAMEASATLGFDALSTMLADATRFGVQVLVAVVILAIGLAFANIAARAVRSSRSEHAETLANVARVGILILAAAMALRQMGLADEIVNLAFGLVLGAIAVAVALAFGLGGREAASRALARLEAERPRGDAGPPESTDEHRTPH